MSKTIYSHRGCGGNVVGKLTGFVLVSPFISARYGKLEVANFQFLTDDLLTPRGEKDVKLVYLCMKCKQEIPLDKMGDEIIAYCSICGKPFPIGELWATEYSPINCKSCLDKLKGEDSEELRKMFDLPLKFKKSLLVEGLQLPIKI